MTPAELHAQRHDSWEQAYKAMKKLAERVTSECALAVEALEYHQEQTRPIQKTIDALAAIAASKEES